MKKSLFVVATLLLISSNQMLACDYYEDKSVILKTLETGIYHKNISGVVCLSVFDKTIAIPIKNGKVEGLLKAYYESGALKEEVNFKNGKLEGLAKWYYKSGVLKQEGNYKNNWLEGLVKLYSESGALKEEASYENDKREGLTIVYLENGRKFAEIYYGNNNPISGKCADGRKWTNAELSNWEKGLKVSCGY